MENIKLKGSKNIRELGNIKSANGTLKKGAFLRGSHLQRLTDKDIKILTEQYNVTAILDLRSSREVMERPDVSIPDTIYRHYPIFGGAVKGITHERATENAEQSSNQNNMCKLYEEMVSEKYAENLKKIFTFILNRKAKDGALLFHCSEGKDRTGIVTMILLWLLDVPKETIMQDYLYTNTVNEKKAKKSYFFISLFQGDNLHAEHVRDAYLAKEEYLTAAIKKIENDWGNAENFVHKALGIDTEVIVNFRKEFLTS